jgi:hypothetical protein
MTEDETDFLRAVWSEARGNEDEWVALTELPAEATALARSGYLHVATTGRAPGASPARRMVPTSRESYSSKRETAYQRGTSGPQR